MCIRDRGKDGYMQFNASKGVIVACGDYQNDEEMLHYYQPDMTNFEPKQTNKTGDGHKMVVWAGGKIEDLAHTKMLHDFDAGPASMGDLSLIHIYRIVKIARDGLADEEQGFLEPLADLVARRVTLADLAERSERA